MFSFSNDHHCCMIIISFIGNKMVLPKLCWTYEIPCLEDLTVHALNMLNHLYCGSFNSCRCEIVDGWNFAKIGEIIFLLTWLDFLGIYIWNIFANMFLHSPTWHIRSETSKENWLRCYYFNHMMGTSSRLRSMKLMLTHHWQRYIICEDN